MNCLHLLSVLALAASAIASDVLGEYVFELTCTEVTVGNINLDPPQLEGLSRFHSFIWHCHFVTKKIKILRYNFISRKV